MNMMVYKVAMYVPGLKITHWQVRAPLVWLLAAPELPIRGEPKSDAGRMLAEGWWAWDLPTPSKASRFTAIQEAAISLQMV